MKLNLPRELVLLQKLTTKQLKQKYAQLFGEGTNTNNRTWLMRRILWRLQANEQGDLSEKGCNRVNYLNAKWESADV